MPIMVCWLNDLGIGFRFGLTLNISRFSSLKFAAQPDLLLAYITLFRQAFMMISTVITI